MKKVLVVFLAAISVFAVQSFTPQSCLQDGTHCSFEDCVKKGEVFVMKNEDTPWDFCAPHKDVIEVSTCEPNFCNYALCTDKKPEECKPSEALVPKDGLCHCCHTCVKKKKIL